MLVDDARIEADPRLRAIAELDRAQVLLIGVDPLRADAEPPGDVRDRKELRRRRPAEIWLSSEFEHAPSDRVDERRIKPGSFPDGSMLEWLSHGLRQSEDRDAASLA